MKFLLWLAVLGLLALRAVAQLAAGDIAIVAYNSDSPDEFAWVALTAIPSNTVINFTDASVSNGCFRWEEHLSTFQGGPLTWVHTRNLAPGDVVRFAGATASWTVGAAGNKPPQFSASGDQIFAYTGAIVKNEALPVAYQGDPSGAVILAGINFGNGGWTNANAAPFSTVPAGISAGSGTAVSTTPRDNGYYSGILTGSVQQIRRAIAIPANWTTSDTYISPAHWPAQLEILPETILFEFSYMRQRIPHRP